MYIGLALDLIKKHEGLRLKPYKDTVGKLTIGYGRNLDDNGISQYEAEVLLHDDVQLCYAQCIKLPCWDKLNEARKAALLDMCFNLGITRLKTFKNMFGALEVGAYNRAAAEMLNSKWAAQVKTRATELAEIMIKGELYGLDH